MTSVKPTIIKLIRKNFEKRHEFIPGKTRIALIEPAFGPDEVIEALDSLLTTNVTMGKKVKRFEHLFSRYIKSRFSSMVNSGSSANLVALSALTNPWFQRRIKKNTEVITPAVTWATTVYPLYNLNLKPKFVDINLENFCMKTDDLDRAVSSNTSLLLPVHLLGNVCDMSIIKEVATKKDLLIMEDCCEAHGAEFKGKKVGTLGDIGTFSFFLSHHITTMEGGMVVTNDESLHELSKALRAFGWIRDLKLKEKFMSKYPHIDPRYLFVNLGYNFRPLEIQGAFGIHQIAKLENFIKIRKENARYWSRRFSQYEDYFILTKETPHTRSVYFCYPLTIKKDAPFDRKHLLNYLKTKKIETRPIMSGNFLEQPTIEFIPHAKYGKLENSKLAMRNSFFFGNHHEIDKPQREYVVDVIAQFIECKLWKR
ncbi:MAG TPA: DegT/DnrJ/EryC1/StrS family aminotransferase [Nitrosopumilaceae archaeon]|nr:DegT/DnrJ/EryC1/StrS family aminotransferase [Nitrosopumilaceae archaeon]